MARMFFFAVALGCLFGGIPACSPQAERDGMRYRSENSRADDRDLAELKKMFTPSAGERAADRAAINWPECADRTDESSKICALWRDNDLDFSLKAVKNHQGGPIPVVESKLINNESNNKIAIHLTGGTDLPVYSFYSDSRTQYNLFFHKNGYKIVSVAYWGTNFRTNLMESEIVFAVNDFQTVYDSYARSCHCEPIVIAESLGAAILFNFLKKNESKKINFLAISPVMNGIDDAISYYKNQETPNKFVNSAKTSNVYALGSEGKYHRIGKRMINSLDHLSSFVGAESTKFDFGTSMPTCFNFLIGTNDPLNAKFNEWDRAGVMKISNAGHDLAGAKSPELQSVFADFIECVRRNAVDS